MTTKGHNKWRNENECEFTGTILRSSQPFSLWVALDTDDVQTVSLLQSKVGLTASVVHTSLNLVNGLQGANQLAHTAMHKHKGTKGT